MRGQQQQRRGGAGSDLPYSPGQQQYPPPPTSPLLTSGSPSSPMSSTSPRSPPSQQIHHSASAPYRSQTQTQTPRATRRSSSGISTPSYRPSPYAERKRSSASSATYSSSTPILSPSLSNVTPTSPGSTTPRRRGNSGSGVSPLSSSRHKRTTNVPLQYLANGTPSPPSSRHRRYGNGTMHKAHDSLESLEFPRLSLPSNGMDAGNGTVSRNGHGYGADNNGSSSSPHNGNGNSEGSGSAGGVKRSCSCLGSRKKRSRRKRLVVVAGVAGLAGLMGLQYAQSIRAVIGGGTRIQKRTTSLSLRNETIAPISSASLADAAISLAGKLGVIPGLGTSSHKRMENAQRSTQSSVYAQDTTARFMGNATRERIRMGGGNAARQRSGYIAPRIFYASFGSRRNGRNTTATTTTIAYKRRRKVQTYPAEQSDETQLYPEIDSLDYPYNETMQVRHFPPQKGDFFGGKDKNARFECQPMADWQKTFHPTCNEFHGVDSSAALLNSQLTYLGGGNWRDAYSLVDPLVSSVIYKTWRTHHRFEDFYYELNRIDAVVMERLTSSPYVINVYGLCGTSSMSQAAAERLTSVADKATMLGKLKLVREIAAALSQIHAMHIVHNDLNTGAVLMADDCETPILNDFNIAQLMLRDDSKKKCGYVGEHWNPQWRAPEEIRSYLGLDHDPLTDRVDIYALGNIIYRFVAGKRAWHLGHGSMTDEYQSQIATWKRKEGRMPSIPKSVLEPKADNATSALLHIMERCYRMKPSERPSAKDIVKSIDETLFKMKR